MTDHSVYLEENFQLFTEMPGFPYLRLNHLLFSDEVNSNLLSNPSEQLLLVMHCRPAELLVMSDKRVLLYKIPRSKSFLRKSVDFGIGFIPGVGELLDGASTMKSVAQGTGDVISWGSPSARRKAAQRKKEGMPSKKEIRDLVWNIRKPETLAMIVCYRNQILFENGFGWKVKFEQAFDSPTEILVSGDGISINIGNSRKFIRYAKSEWNFVEIAHYLVEQNRNLLEMKGWTVNIAPEEIMFRKGSLVY